MKETILITAASGVLGRAIVDAAVKAGLAVRQGVRDPGKAAPNVAAVRLDYTAPATAPPAIEGMSGLVLIAPPLDGNAPAELGPVIGAAKTAGVKHIVFISAFGVNHNEQAPLRVVEHMVIDSGIPYTILRPNFFMENFSEGFLAGGIRSHGAISLAAGDGKTSFISVLDIAAVVVAAFQKPLICQEFDLTGPEALDHTEVARIISRVSGRAIAYEPLTDEQMAAGARALGMPEPAVEYLSVLYGVVRAGWASGIVGDVEKAIGRAPLRFQDFAGSAAEAWK